MLHCVGLCGTLFFNGCRNSTSHSTRISQLIFIIDDGSLFNGLQSINQWHIYFHHPSPTILGLMNSAGFLPGVIASFCADQVGQYIGRRATIWIGTVIVVCFLRKLSLNTTEQIIDRWRSCYVRLHIRRDVLRRQSRNGLWDIICTHDSTNYATGNSTPTLQGTNSQLL